MPTFTREPIDILLVEDSSSDALLTREALDISQVYNRMHHVTDGVKALGFLRREGEYADKPRPGLILLDLNLPKKNGLEVLAEIKADDSLQAIPVVILTTSKASDDIAQAYALHANCYVTKPLDLGRYVEVVRSVHDFWLGVAVIPSPAE